MKRNGLLIATLMLLVGGAGAYFLSRAPQSVEQKLTTYLGSDGLSEILVENKEKSIKLSHDKSLNQWTIHVKDQPDLIADASKIVKLLDSLNEAKVLQNVTKKTEHYDRFELTDQKATKVTVKYGERENRVFYLGKEKDYSSQFVRKGDLPQVYLISHNFNLNLDSNEWLHKKLKFEKDALKTIDYQTKDKKRLSLDYDASKNDFILKGELPKKKKLKSLSSLADQFTDISFKSIADTKSAPKGKAVVKHTLTLKDDTRVSYKFIESKEKKGSQKYFLDLEIESKNSTPNPKMDYLATLAKNHLFELHSIPTYTFQKSWTDFFEEIKEEPKTEDKTKAP